LFDQNGGTNIGIGQAVLANFVALPAGFQISGNVQAGGTNLAGVGVFASATINGQSFNVSEDTDASGNYSLSVGPGSWNLSVNCNGGSDSLDNILGAGNYVCPNGTNITINNGNSAANFTVQFPSYDAYVSGTVVDNSGNPVGNMNLFAFFNGGGSTYYQATTDQNGNYRMGVDAGSYDMQLDTDPNSGAPARGLVSPFLPITVTTGVNISNLVLVAQHVTGSINGSVTNASNHTGVGGIYLSANATVNGTNYSSGAEQTASDGLVTLEVCNGTWNVSADCNGLNADGFNCPNNLEVNIVNDSAAANFLVSPTVVTPPTLNAPGLLSGHFEMTLTGVANQNYTVQSSTTLTNWSLLFVTNSGPSASVTVTDPAPATSRKFYRILVGP